MTYGYGSSPEELRDRIDDLTKRVAALEDEVAVLRAAAPAVADLERLVKEFRVRQKITVEHVASDGDEPSYWLGKCAPCCVTVTSPDEVTGWLEEHVAQHLAKPGA